jgi:flagellar motor switch protein FliG
MTKKEIVAFLNKEVPQTIALIIIIVFGCLAIGILLCQYLNIVKYG